MCLTNSLLAKGNYAGRKGEIMAASIAINFFDAVVFNDALCLIKVQQGQFVLCEPWPLNIDGGLVSGGVSISPNLLSLTTTQQPIVAGGSMTIPLAANGGGQPPIITVTGFSGEAYLAWPLGVGGQSTTLLQSGAPVTLTGFVG